MYKVTVTWPDDMSVDSTYPTIERALTVCRIVLEQSRESDPPTITIDTL